MTNAKRHLISILLGAGVSVALFYMMQVMISSDGDVRLLSEDYNVIEFVRYQPPEEIPPEQKQQLPEPPKKLTPPEIPKVESMQASKPAVEEPLMPALNISAPLRMSGTPFIGVGALNTELGEAIPLIRIPPRYPLAAQRRNLSGKVLVKFVINEQGLVENPVILEAQPEKVFDNAALQAILRWKFKPKIENGVAVKREATQVFNFEPKQ